MTLTALGIKVAINGSETDTDVVADSAAWTTKIGEVRVTHGGGSWTRTATPAVCQFTAKLPTRYAAGVRTITVAMSVIPSMTANPTDPADDTGVTGAGSYRIIFHGNVQSIRAYEVDRDEDEGTVVQFDAVSDMSALMNRRARCAASTNSGLGQMLNDIETAHGLTMDGNGAFPSVANGFPNSDRPKQKRLTNGEYLATMAAPTGAWVIEDWAGTITAPELRWRVDHYDENYCTYSSLASYRALEIGYPWKLTYDDLGWSYGDFVARVWVNGEDSAANQYYGWARINNSYGVRDDLGNRETAVTSYIDTAADCKLWATRLLAYQGSPPLSLRMNSCTLNTEVYYKALVDGGAYYPPSPGTPEAIAELFYLATMFPGDRLHARGFELTDVSGSPGFGDGNSDYGDWPSGTTDLAAALSRLWYPLIGDIDANAGNAYNYGDVQGIRQVTRTFTPNGGWDVTFGLLPWSTAIRGADVDAADKDQGTD